VNPNTVARAYRELERDEIIETAPGRGSFVRGNGSTGSTKGAANDVARDAFDTALREAKSIGLSRDDVRSLINVAIDRWFPEER
ncbi:MAG: GntR family transcriptional regulator, partial [Candidatus Eremiobacteraeota bacterium]|nr:GntR family transcriptional regulator [Candidatus Eremiobacteraeota bacterium]